MDSSSKWLKEYSQKGIPSSFRSEPSGAVTYFNEFLRKRGIRSGRGLDLGCGKGRNSFFLAKQGFSMQAIDFVPEIVEEVNAAAAKQGIAVNAICASVTQRLPFDSKSFDFAIDVFCYKHATDKNAQRGYRNELLRVLKDDGYYLLSLAGDDDGFYGPLLAHSPQPENKMVVDPVTGVGSYLYSREDVEKEFAPEFETVDFQQKKQRGPMHGKEYGRSTLVFIMGKKK